MTGASALRRAKALYTATAHGTGRALTRAHLLPADPPPIDRRATHWVYSLARPHDVGALVELGVPWWTYRAIGAVDAWLARRDAPRVFEYGSGASTRWLADRADEVHSVEHDRRFADYLDTSGLLPANAHLSVVEPVASPHPAVPSAKEGQSDLDFAGYVAAIDAVPGVFDLIVIDGRARAACLQRARPRLSDDGVIVFDNSRRRRYRRAIVSSGLVEHRLRGLTPTLPYPEQTSLLRAPESRPIG